MGVLLYIFLFFTPLNVLLSGTVIFPVRGTAFFPVGPPGRLHISCSSGFPHRTDEWTPASHDRTPRSCSVVFVLPEDNPLRPAPLHRSMRSPSEIASDEQTVVCPPRFRYSDTVSVRHRVSVPHIGDPLSSWSVMSAVSASSASWRCTQ